MTQAIFHTLADGTQIGWNGIGGAPFYAPDTATGALRMPDLRGMYIEAAGFDSLGVGGVHGDAIRNILGTFDGLQYPRSITLAGAFTNLRVTANKAPHADWGGYAVDFDPSRVVPTANKNQPRAWGALACVYLGAPR